MRLPITLASFVLLGASHAATADTARTVDFTQQVANPTGGQCPQRTAHYFIAAGGDGAGMLSIASQWSCSASSGNASIGVCQVDQTLKCRTDIQFRDKSGNPIDLSGYAVTLKGVTARGEFHPWVDPQGAAPIIKAKKGVKIGILSIGSCDGAVKEALDILGRQGTEVNYLRVRGFPFSKQVDEFLAQHERIFVVEQNRDAQLRSMLLIETEVDRRKLHSILHYSGMPIDCRCIVDGVTQALSKGAAA